jgi:hypothetical protein
LVAFVGLAPCLGQEPKNILTNGNFETGAATPWNIWSGGGSTCAFEVVTACTGATVPEKPIEGKYCLHVTVSGASTGNWWDAGMNQTIPNLQKGKKYTLSIWLKGKSGTAMINLKPEHAADPDWAGYGEKVITMTDTWTEYSITTPVLDADVSPMSMTFHLAFAKADFWMDAVRWYEGDYAPPAFLKPWGASNPSPGVDATDVVRDAVLSWKAGPFAKSHDVYFGTSLEDVNSATVAKPLSTTVTAGLKETSLDPAGLLDYGTIYYWRVDEVNAPPDSTVYQGKIWSFTTEEYAYPITSVTATASSANVVQGMTAIKTVNGSGLDPATDEHGNVGADQWLTAPKIKLPAWIRYDFDKAYVIQQMHVWNSNQTAESLVGYGAKDVLIEYSMDGTNYSPLNTREFEQADGTANYAGFTVPMGGVQAKSIRLTINSNWTNFGPIVPQTGLSEVRFLSIPVFAREPSPAAYAENVPVDSSLTWREGRQAVSNKVYMSADKAAVANGTAPATTTTERSFQPSALDFGQNYYWKVDEVNDAAPTPVWAGDLWAFTTSEWAPIDDFESYNNESPNRVFQTWIDGWGFSKDDNFPQGNPGNGTGALVGYDPSVGNIMETGIVHGGSQAMPVEYNNVSSPFYSEVGPGSKMGVSG